MTIFRNYNKAEVSVRNLYKKMYTQQTYGKKIALKKLITYTKELTLDEAVQYLNQIIDESDPDVDFEQIYHGYQTSETIRNKYFKDNKLCTDISIKSLFNDEEWKLLPEEQKQLYNTTIDKLYSSIKDWNWLILIGLIHDLGKVLILKEFYNLEQHFAVGDIYPLGCSFHKSNIYYDEKWHTHNIDFYNRDYNKELGVYKKNCGFDNIEMTFSHDYYLSNLLYKSTTNLPIEALYIIKYHSFYCWHSPRNNIRGYEYLASEYDWKMLPLLKLFQKTDLYSKDLELPNIKKIKKYYNNLINKYIPNKLLF